MTPAEANHLLDSFEEACAIRVIGAFMEKLIAHGVPAGTPEKGRAAVTASVAQYDQLKASLLEKLITLPEPTRTGKTVNIDGHICKKGIQYLGFAHEMSDGTWRALANVNGMLAIVQCSVKETNE